MFDVHVNKAMATAFFVSTFSNVLEPIRSTVLELEEGFAGIEFSGRAAIALG